VCCLYLCRGNPPHYRAAYLGVNIWVCDCGTFQAGQRPRGILLKMIVINK
jgi:hypothetical protein